MQVAELYKKARGTKLSKPKLRAAMAEMDADGNGEVELSEFQEWWAANGGDLEQQRGGRGRWSSRAGWSCCWWRRSSRPSARGSRSART